MIGILLGQGRIDIREGNREASVAANGGQEPLDDNNWEKEFLIIKAAELYRDIFGQRSSRQDWR